MLRRSPLPVVILGGVWCCLSLACTAPGGPGSLQGNESEFKGGAPSTGGGADASAPVDAEIMKVVIPLTCAPAASSVMMPARSTITAASDSMMTAPMAQVYFTSDLFNLFKTVCGGCHVESNLGVPPFNVSAMTFTKVVDQSVVDRITTDDPNLAMPPQAPGAPAYSMRPDTDPTHQLASLLETWIMQNRPPGSFMVGASSTSSSTMADYSLTPDLGNALTNIGSCVPAGTVGQNSGTMDQMDAFFASATELPDTLGETDLTTLDSMTLAANGVISYAPTYPLWSDNSGKMRYIRVPRGQSVVFDKGTQTFRIPNNTRFYKTFLKQLVDANGNMTYRKIETRVIVARQDTDPAAGSSAETIQNALFGTYVWNDDETAATLLKDPRRDGTPFSDRVLTYFTDEQKAQEIIATNPADLEGALSEVPGLLRHYALPGRERCIDCHMGSPTLDFVLGFTPLQVNRRATDTGGTYEPAMGDELTQLQRMIDYGVISGMSSPADVLPLEQSEGTRAPRNDYELKAQAYMTGNCAHCHNPRGFPTKKAPALKDVLNFLPSVSGGVFQFPLDRTSPVRQRGPSQQTPVPYVTPSLFDYPSAGHHGKWIDCKGDTFNDVCTSSAPAFILAPWRSLIYRNVDTPFDYVDDATIFPHMPMNSAGYDCRAPHIMGEWMTSIPAKLASPYLNEAATWTKGSVYPPDVDADPQPYVEVKPGDLGYADAVAAAALRMGAYQKGYRYGFCPDSTDIFDPWILNETASNSIVTPDVEDTPDPNDPLKVLWPNSALGVPIKPHWVVTDTTDPPPPWNPRRPDWANALLKGDPGDTSTLGPGDADALKNVVAALQTAKLTSDIRTALTTKVPFGVWQNKSSCNFTGIPTAASYQGAARPQWMDVAQVDATAPIYEELPGAAVFNTICFNCHGPLANAEGLLADEIALMTGGDARVADFRDGLLGPITTPGMNRQPIFVDPNGAVTGDEITARYVAWMALGGTLKHLPSQLLDLVSNTPVLGLFRNAKYIDPVGTPDMLRLGLELCTDVIASNYDVQNIGLGPFLLTGRINWSQQTPLIDVNGDAELWLKLCGIGNRAIVRVPVVSWSSATTGSDLNVQGNGSLYWGDAYPANAPVMDQRGRVTNGIAPDNTFPLCIRKPTDATERMSADTFLASHKVNGNSIPYCPDALFPSANPSMYQLQYGVDQDNNPDFIDAKKWAARGAVNAGMAVFLYLDSVERGTTQVLPGYDQCDHLTSTPGK
jgi:mono/diheme cytochrome c family protein